MDTFTGSATYKNIFLRTLKPNFIAPFIQETAVGTLPNRSDQELEEQQMSTKQALGKLYQDGETILNQGGRLSLRHGNENENVIPGRSIP